MEQFLRRILLVPAAFALANPAEAWEFGISDSGDTFWTVAEDFFGDAGLAFYCNLSMPGDIQAKIIVEQGGPARPVPVELRFDVSGRSFGPIEATADGAEGVLTVATRDRTGVMGEAARAIYAERATVLLFYSESTWRFEGGDHSDDFGAMLEACG